MKVNEIKSGQKVALIKVKIKTLGDIEQKGSHQYQAATVEDETGEIKFAFWNEQVNTFKEGDEMVVTDGWCKEFQEELVFSSGKFGSIKAVEKKEE